MNQALTHHRASAFVGGHNCRHKAEPRALEPTEVLDASPPVAYRVSDLAALAISVMADSDEGDPMREAMGRGKIKGWDSFVLELFSRLYDEDHTDRLTEPQTWALKAIELIEELPQWARVRIAAYRGGRTVAGKAAAWAADLVRGEIEKLMPEEEPETEEEQATALEAAVEAMVQAAASTQGLKLAGLGGAIGVMAAQVEAEADVADMGAALGFSRDGVGRIDAVSPELATQLRADKRFRRIVNLAGRMREAAQGQAIRGTGRADIVGLDLVQDIGQTTSRFRARMSGDDADGLLATLELLDGQAEGWERADELPRARGDVAVLVDRSGSMMGAPAEAARALGVASVTQALSDGRRVVGGSFAGHGDADLHAARPGDRQATARLLLSICRMPDGGTDVDFAVRKAADLMARFPGGMRSPDVLVITDGYFPPVDDEVLGMLGDRRLLGVMIGTGDQGHPEFARTWAVPSIITDGVAGSVVTELRTAPKKRKT